MSIVLDLTIVIPVKNEENSIISCLNSIGTKFVEKVIVVDSGSTDNTRTNVKDFEVELIDFDWNGKFPKKRNWFLRNHTPATKWVMFIDADECLTEDFKKELRVKLEDQTKSGYWLSYTRYFMGKKLKGGYPLRKLALFKVGAGEYEFIDEDNWSKLDMEVHEHPILTGKIGTIKSRIEHQDFRGISHYLAKHAEYADWEALRFLKLTSDRNVLARLSWTQRLKYRLMNSVWLGPCYFIANYVLLGGFRDGSKGLAFAIFKLSYFTQIFSKIREFNSVSKGKT